MSAEMSFCRISKPCPGGAIGRDEDEAALEKRPRKIEGTYARAKEEAPGSVTGAFTQTHFQNNSAGSAA
jgi:hypothetical protein